VVVGSYVPKSSEQLTYLLEGGQIGKMEVRGRGWEKRTEEEGRA